MSNGSSAVCLGGARPESSVCSPTSTLAVRALGGSWSLLRATATTVGSGADLPHDAATAMKST